MKRVDLNLLGVFYAVMAEGNVTRAAKRLSMTQPAVSNALRRLRHLYQDELFVKSAEGVCPTPRALALWPTIEEGLEKIWSVTESSRFTPAKTELTFNIAITDTLISRVFVPLAVRLAQEAPLARWNFHPYSDPGSQTGLERGNLDCAVGMFPNLAAGLRLEPLFADDFVCVFQRGRPRLKGPLSLDQFVAARHVLVKQAIGQAGIVDTWLSLTGRKCEIAMIVNRASEAVSVVEATDMLATVPRSFVNALPGAAALGVAELPFEHPRILYKMVWHERTSRDPAKIWLRSVVQDVVGAVEPQHL